MTDITSTLEAARRGDHGAFEALTRPHLRELHVHCYRMLGSVDDADEALQQTLIAAWRGIADFEGRSSPRTWLYRIATHRCLNAIRDGKRRPPPVPEPPFPPPAANGSVDVGWLQPYPDALLDADPARRAQTRESVALAFVSALQTLSPRQTAALLLCDVLGFTSAETADMLDTTATAVKGLLQRARASTPPPAPPADAGEESLARRFAAAFTADDVDAVVDLLTDDAWLTMPPADEEYRGRAAIAGMLAASAAARDGRRFILRATRANRQPAFACYRRDPERPIAHGTGVIVLTIERGRVAGITRFLGRRLHERFGMPAYIDAASKPADGELL
ncbi:MAG TPA: RNA polymerase subunit sigma-70 [Stackebrandtia sp.]|uniref:RNA polymerase subunit sigma-70 n=1 Tax=Stackebrandtia sp. TaxID=2023065 RepID=UPI002D3AD720|nr:RNA polymerase subunit sigma-70 [Stackebrandtia sp.]HZE38836.1 RNA polymerase subunit sigma-70 [Stackebrandtia sp.]